jgi:hypothetical protein
MAKIVPTTPIIIIIFRKMIYFVKKSQEKDFSIYIPSYFSTRIFVLIFQPVVQIELHYVVIYLKKNNKKKSKNLFLLANLPARSSRSDKFLSRSNTLSTFCRIISTTSSTCACCCAKRFEPPPPGAPGPPPPLVVLF